LKLTKLTKTKSESKTGFTLIELMIVVAIIGILSAVAIPNFLRAANKAKFTSCVETLTSVKVAEEMYISDNGVYTSEPDYLAMYMIAGCDEPDGSDCTGEVNSRVAGNCDDFDLGGTVEYEYEIVGTSKEKFQCGVCINAKGVAPEKYEVSCPNPAVCP